MKIQIKLLVATVCLLLNACYKHQPQNVLPTAESSIANKKDIKISQEDEKVLEKKDTVFNDLRIKYEIIKTSSKIFYFEFGDGGTKERKYAYDNFVNISITKNGKEIFAKKITKNNFQKFVTKKIDEYQLSIFNIDELAKDRSVFFVNICKPETDDCYTFNLLIDNAGNSNIIEAHIYEEY